MCCRCGRVRERVRGRLCAGAESHTGSSGLRSRSFAPRLFCTPAMAPASVFWGRPGALRHSSSALPTDRRLRARPTGSLGGPTESGWSHRQRARVPSGPGLWSGREQPRAKWPAAKARNATAADPVVPTCRAALLLRSAHCVVPRRAAVSRARAAGSVQMRLADAAVRLGFSGPRAPTARCDVGVTLPLACVALVKALQQGAEPVSMHSPRSRRRAHCPSHGSEPSGPSRASSVNVQGEVHAAGPIRASTRSGGSLKLAACGDNSCGHRWCWLWSSGSVASMASTGLP